MAIASTRVLVTGVGGRSVGHQILHALLQVGDRYRIVATDADAFSFGLYQVENRYIVPLAASLDYLPAIREILERERIQVILPGTQPEVAILAEHGESLADSGCLVIAGPSQVIRRCSNKRELSDWLVADGFDVPRAAPSARWRDLVAESGFPVVGKPTEDTGGSRHIALLKDEAEVEGYLVEMDRTQTEVMIQEYVGSAETEYTVGVLVSRGGSLIDSIVLHRKLTGLSLGIERVIEGRRYALSTGYSQGTIVRHPLVQETCERLALRLGSRGPLNIQCRVAGDRVKVFEVHPRFSGTTSIRAEVGFNEPDILIRNYLLGEDTGRINYQSDVAAIRAFRSIIVPVATMLNVPRGGHHG